MSKWKIYDKNGVERKIQWTPQVEESVEDWVEPQLEYHGTWMGECFVTITVKCAVPVDFAIGDYLIYRGEKFVLANDPSVIKKARRGSYGEGFTYSNIKFNALHNELTEIMFLDYVLDDNEIHYTSLPVFPFFAADIDDYCDRLQVNTNRYCQENGFTVMEYWLFLTPSLTRTRQRAVLSNVQGLEQEAIRRWNAAYGEGTDTSDEKKNISVSVSNQTIWNSLSLIKSEFGLNFINRGRSVIVGSAGLPTTMFSYGKGNGLYEIERNADTDQAIITKLYSYGSEKNMPVRYYANLNMQVYGTVTRVVRTSPLTYVMLDINFKKEYFTTPDESLPGEYDVRVTDNNGQTETGCVYSAYADAQEGEEGKCELWVNHTFNATVGMKIYFTEGVDKDQWPTDHRDYATQNLPNNMAVNCLMLPGFPNMSLYDWVKANGGTDCVDATGQATWHGYTAYFSKDQYRPYVQSLNVTELGVREGVKTFNGSDDTDEIYPTIENTLYDTIYHSDIINDNGIMPDGVEEIPNFNITLPAFPVEFKLDELVELGTSPTIVMKSGYCAGREFKIASAKKDSNGRWVCSCEREYDDLLQIYFPYSDSVAHGGSVTADEAYQVRGSDITGYDGDKYVLTGIQMTDTYINAAAVKLLEATLEMLSKNDYTRYTYLPKIDELYMKRQHDEYLKGLSLTSLYLTIKEGDLLRFEDEDLRISDSLVFIDTLTIKEYGNDKIPTFETTLRSDKAVGAIQRIQNQINSLSNTVSNGGGVNANQLNRIIEGTGERLFLSKTKDDTAQGEIGFLKGLWIKAKGLFGFDADGNVKANNLNVANDGIFGRLVRAVTGYFSSIQSENYSGDGIGDTGWAVLTDGNGSSRAVFDYLYVRRKSIFEELEIKKRSVTAGDQTFVQATTKILMCDYLDSNDEPLGYETVKAPWLLQGVPTFLSRAALNLGIFSRTVEVRKVLTSAELAQVKKVRCYFLATDDDGNAVDNLWHENDLARCQTFNLNQQNRPYGTNSENIPYEDGTGYYTRAQNTFWWRKVIKGGNSTGYQTIEKDGRTYHWFDVYCNYAAEHPASGTAVWNDAAEGSDLPCAGDAVCQFGNTVDTNRMNAVTIEINGPSSAIKAYRGIYTFDLSKCWWGGSPCKMTLDPAHKFQFFGPSFEFVQEYGISKVPDDRGLWIDIVPTRDDYPPHNNVRKCYYYNRVSNGGSLWLCTLTEAYHWVADESIYYGGVSYAAGDMVPDGIYGASDFPKSKCSHKLNYTTDEPSSNSSAWEKQVDRGNGIVSITTTYARSSQASTADETTAPTIDGSWSSSMPTLTDTYKYMWRKEVTAYNDSSNNTTKYYLAAVKGEQGTNGYDGWMITADPANVIITQSLGNDTTQFSTVMVGFMAKKGGQTVAVDSLSVPTGRQSLSDEFNAAIGTGANAKKVIVSSPQTHGTPAVYYTEGTFDVDVNVTDPDTNATVTFTITVPCYANLLGTWKRSVEGGVETIVAQLTQYLEDENGNIITSLSLRNDIDDATQSITTITKKINNGKNLLPLTKGWEGYQGAAVSYDKENFGVRNANGSLYSPVFLGVEGETYCFSVYLASGNQLTGNPGYCYDSDAPTTYISELDDNGTYQSASFIEVTGDTITIGNTTYQRYYFLIPGSIVKERYFTIYNDGNYWFYCPQLEVGNTPSAFAADSIETTSQIKQTANEIEAKVNDTGVRINNGYIDLMAGKVNFVDSNGNPFQTPKIVIDPTTGALYAIDGEFEGDLKSGAYIENNIQKYANLLNKNGDGHLAKGNISWDANGNVSVHGIIKATMVYSPTDIAAGGEWTINPASNNPNCYFCQPGLGGSEIILPDPTTYDGLEISFLTPYGTQSTGTTWLKVASGVSYKIIFPPYDAVTINSTTYYLPRQDGTMMQMSSKVYLPYNQLIKIRAINNNWYVVDGRVEASS